MNRDLMTVRFFLKSDVKVEGIEYFLTVEDWAATNFTFVINFNKPMEIS